MRLIVGEAVAVTLLPLDQVHVGLVEEAVRASQHAKTLISLSGSRLGPHQPESPPAPLPEVARTASSRANGRAWADDADFYASARRR